MRLAACGILLILILPTASAAHATIVVGLHSASPSDPGGTSIGNTYIVPTSGSLGPPGKVGYVNVAAIPAHVRLDQWPVAHGIERGEASLAYPIFLLMPSAENDRSRYHWIVGTEAGVPISVAVVVGEQGDDPIVLVECGERCDELLPRIGPALQRQTLLYWRIADALERAHAIEADTMPLASAQLEAGDHAAARIGVANALHALTLAAAPLHVDPSLDPGSPLSAMIRDAAEFRISQRDQALYAATTRLTSLQGSVEIQAAALRELDSARLTLANTIIAAGAFLVSVASVFAAIYLISLEKRKFAQAEARMMESQAAIVLALTNAQTMPPNE